MDLRNRIGLYGSYFLGMAGIGFTLPYLPLYLGEKGLDDRAISQVSALAALAGLAQFPVGIWSDRLGWRKPFLLVALGSVAAATVLLRGAHGAIWLGVLVVLFAENGIGRAVVESLAGAEAAALAKAGETGAALGALRFWKPAGIILMLLLGSWMAGHARGGLESILVPLAVVQGLAFLAAFLIHEDRAAGTPEEEQPPAEDGGNGRSGWFPKDRGLWCFVAAMVLYHSANAPGGVYLGMYLKRGLHAAPSIPAYAFLVSMIAWTLVVFPAGRLADRIGRKPLLVAGWTIMAVRLALVAVLKSPWLLVANQALDGLGNGLFAVIAAAWVTDRFADPRRVGEAQVLVGAALVGGSALGPFVSGFFVERLGYPAMFGVLAGVGAVATAIVIFFVPETAGKRRDGARKPAGEPMATTSDLSTTP